MGVGGLVLGVDSQPLSSLRAVSFSLFAALAVSLALNVVASWWGLPGRFSWAPDELQPGVILEGISVRFSGDWHQPAYPPLHYYLLAVSYLPARALGVTDPRDVHDATVFIALGRLLSLAMGMGIVLILYRTARELFDSRTALLTAAVATLNVPFVYYAKTANLDVPLAFWVLLSLYYLVRLTRTDTLRDFLLFTVFAVCATLTKDQAFAFYVLPLAWLLVRRFREKRVLFDRQITGSLLTGAALFLVLHNVVFNWQGFIHHFEEILWARGAYSEFETGPSSQLALLAQTLRHALFALGWPFALAALGGLYLAWREPERRAALWLALAGASYYLFFIAPVLSTWLRYALPLSLLAAPFAALALDALWPRGVAARLGVAAALLYALARAASVDTLLLQDSRYTVEAWLESNVADGETVGFIGPEYYLPRLDAFDTQRLRPTLSVLERSRPDFVVVNPEFGERFQEGTREHELFERLAAGRAGYGLAFEHRSEPRAMLLDFDGLLANMSKINPLIRVYQRAD